MRPVTYFSVDVETDGPIPGEYSMLSFGIVVAGRTGANGEFFPSGPSAAKLYTELKPTFWRYEQEALDVNGFDRDRLREEGECPTDAMSDAWDFVWDCANQTTPVFVGWPLGFDWMFMQYYFGRFAGFGSPFKFSHAYDMKTALAVKMGVPVTEVSLKRLPQGFPQWPKGKHNALVDAQHQAKIFQHLQKM